MTRAGGPVIALVLALTLGVTAGACQESIPPDLASDAGAADAALPPLESSPPAVIAPEKRRDAVSSPVVFDPLRGGAWTANGDVGTLAYVDIDAPRVVAEIAIGKDVRSVALSPDAMWIAAVDRESGAVALVDAETFVVRRVIPLGLHPRAAVWDAADPRWLYVAVEGGAPLSPGDRPEGDGAIAVVDRTLGVFVRSIQVGRIPAGLAVSKKRAELYVTHRIDAHVSVVDLAQGALVADIPLADQPPNADATVPQGKPFAFEGLAWSADGDVAWAPHELRAPTHPFQFQTSVFPAISVVDLAKRAEVATDKNSGVTGGRKLLFDAINIPDPGGNTSILSQPCAVALHPNAVVGYAIACGSEDLVTFDVTQGIAVDLMRDLPGDHPVGITLDDTGQRALVLFDQSHTLLRLDIAGGSPVKRARILGDPIALVAKDPVDPELREGEKLFFKARSNKGDLATTGNDWLSCGACHLDGFGAANAFLFESSVVADPTKDAQIGHVGLKDMFSTVPAFAGAAFDPHDVLVALLDQGGLAPDRSGQNRAGAVDPSAPTPAARLMASRLARAVARDLPLAPSWLSPSANDAPIGDKPNPAYDGAWCGECHQAEYAAWQKSAHSFAGEDPMVRFGAGVEVMARGPDYERFCVGCHDPVGARLGEGTLASGRGVTCLGCHEVDHPIHVAGNGDLAFTAYDWTIDHRARAHAALDTIRKPSMCGGCHEQFVPSTGVPAIGTFAEWNGSSFAGHGASGGATLCVDCHMAKTNGTADHGFVGGNVYVASLVGAKLGDTTLTPRVTDGLRKAVTLTAARSGSGVRVTVSNSGAGHSFPTGVSDIREPWVELQAVGAQHEVVLRYGGPGADGLLASTSARLGVDIAAADGTVLFRHELTQATRIVLDRRVIAGGAVDLVVVAPASLPPGAVGLDAVLLYRNVRTPYFRAATGDVNGAAPEVEVARVAVP